MSFFLHLLIIGNLMIYNSTKQMNESRLQKCLLYIYFFFPQRGCSCEGRGTGKRVSCMQSTFKQHFFQCDTKHSGKVLFFLFQRSENCLVCHLGIWRLAKSPKILGVFFSLFPVCECLNNERGPTVLHL